MMKIGIIGYGWLAERVGDALKTKHEIFGTTRNPDKAKRLTEKGINMLLWEEEKLRSEDAKKLMDCDVLISSLPVSRVEYDKVTLEHLLTSIKGYKKPMFVFSSTGIYPQEMKTFTEEDTANLVPTIRAYEVFFETHFPQAVILRFAGLLGDNRRFDDFYRNREIPDPQSPVNHLHYNDITAIIELMIEKGTASNLYNIVTPLHPTKAKVFAKQTGQSIPLTEKFSSKGRIISSNKLIKEFNYHFLKPDPSEF